MKKLLFSLAILALVPCAIHTQDEKANLSIEDGILTSTFAGLDKVRNDLQNARNDIKRFIEKAGKKQGRKLQKAVRKIDEALQTLNEYNPAQ